jgi:membrane protease YdiL (CAAX protease family)
MTADTLESPTDAAPQPQPIKGWVVVASPIVGVLLFAVLCIAIVGTVGYSIGSFEPKALQQALLHGPSSYFVAMGASDAFYLALLLGMWLLLPKRGPAALSSYFQPVSGGALLTGVAFGVAMAVLVGPALYFASQTLHFEFKETTGEQMLLPKSLAQLGAVLFAGAVIAPLVEEAYFRGLLLRWLRKRLWLPLAVVIDAALFAVVHGRFITHVGVEGIVVTAVLAIPGVVLSILAIRTNSLWPGIVAHGTYNGILLALSYFAPNLS